MFEKLKQEIPNFVEEHCFWVKPENVVYDETKSQCRQGGHVKEKYPYFRELIESGVDLPPISGIRLPNEMLDLREGATRLGGAKLAGKPLLASDYYDKVKQFTPVDWDEFQAIANDPKIETPNSIGDIELLISKQVNNGDLAKRIGIKYDDNPDEFIKAAAKRYKSVIYKNSGRTIDFFTRKVKSALKPKVQAAGAYENYDKKAALEIYKAQAGSNWNGQRQGEIDNNRTVYPIASMNHLNPNIMGYSASKKISNPDIIIDLVFWTGDIVGKTKDEIIQKERNQVLGWFNKVNATYGFFGDLYVLPQIKQGKNKENLHKLIKLT